MRNIGILLAVLCACAVLPAVSEARVSLHGSSNGYTLKVPGNEVLTGPVVLTLPASAAKHSKLVPYKITCTAGKTDPVVLVTLAATSDGMRTLRGKAASDGLVPGDRCTVKRRSKRVATIRLR